MSNAVPIIAYYFAIAITNRECKKPRNLLIPKDFRIAIWKLQRYVLSFTSSILSKFVALVLFLYI